MASYTFLNLAPDEFEQLSRDLLQEFLSLHLESFKPGKDGGTDLRGYKSEDGTIVVQCKRYADLKNLMAELRREVTKVETLNPGRYILTTSVDLSPANKTQISQIFSGKLSEGDIFSASDLNNLIGKFDAVERRHYKLWLASTNILQSLINNKVLLQSQFEQENLQRISKIYVMNDSFEEAFKIVKDKRFVILSGNPGVGKTTLARVLAYDFVQNGFQLIVASSSIKEAYDGYADGVDQVILFDDFLGRNILEGRYPLNEEQQLVRFIEKIASAKNKILILTTREYILNQAKAKYEIIKSSEIDIAKCIVDVSKYTKYIKAKILYNHLFFAELPIEHLNAILDKQVYFKIIDHQNYNPRIVEAIVKKQDWKNIAPEDYGDKLLQYFDKPYSIWETAYVSEINDLSKILLLILVTTGTPILRDDLRLTLENFSKIHAGKYQLTVNDFSFTNAIRELHNTFITTQMDSYGTVSIEFQNPSIQDFLVDYLANSEGLQEDLIISAVFYNQLFEIFTTPEKAEADKKGYYSTIRIGLNKKLLQILKQKLFAEFETLRSSKISRLTYKDSKKFRWYLDTYGSYKKLELIISNSFSKEKEFPEFIGQTFQPIAVPKKMDGWEYNSYLTVLKFLKDKVSFDPKEVMFAFISHVSYALQLNYFKSFKELFPDQFDDFVSNEVSFKEKLSKVVQTEYSRADKDSFSDAITSIENIVKDYSFNAEDELANLNKQQADYDDYVESSIENMEYNAPANDEPPTENETDRIVDLFNSLH